MAGGTIRVLEGGRDGLCRGCGAKLVWVLSYPNKKPMPFSGPVRIVERTGIVEGDARVLVVSTENVHWSTCPKASTFRNRKAATP